MRGSLDLTPSLEKIGRAERKFDYAVSLMNEWLRNGVRTSVRREMHGQRVYVIARVETPPPEDFVWEIVEAAGQIRSALDKMLVAVVHANGRGVSGVGFPFGGMNPNGEPQPFPTVREDHLKKKFTSDQWDLIMAQQPYPGGNDLLWAVNEIANEDKHRLDLVRVEAALKARSMTFSNAIIRGPLDGSAVDRAAFEFGPDPNFICPDQERETLLASYAFGPGSTHPQIDQSMTVNIVFGPVRPVAGKDVLSTVSQQIRLVKGIVETFRDASTT